MWGKDFPARWQKVGPGQCSPSSRERGRAAFKMNSGSKGEEDERKEQDPQLLPQESRKTCTPVAHPGTHDVQPSARTPLHSF